MAIPTYPGVYVEEISSGVRPIEAAGTSTCVFVGQTERGPEDPKKITSFSEYQKHFGDFYPGTYLAESVYQFFSNGGSICYILRVTKNNAEKASVHIKNRTGDKIPSPIDSSVYDELHASLTGNTSAIATIEAAYSASGDQYIFDDTIADSEKDNVRSILNTFGYISQGIIFSAKNKGVWGNFLYLQIENGFDNPDNEFKISIRKQIEADLEPEPNTTVPALEVFDNLSMDKDAPNYAPLIINNTSNLITLDITDQTLDAEKPFLGPGIHEGAIGVSLLGDPVNPDDNGLGSDRRKFLINIDHDGWLEVVIPYDGPHGILDSDTDLGAIADTITAVVHDLVTGKKHESTPDEAYSQFLCQMVQEPDDSDIMIHISRLDPETYDKYMDAILVEDHRILVENAYTEDRDAGGILLGYDIDVGYSDLELVKNILDPLVYKRHLVLISGTNGINATEKYHNSSVQIRKAANADKDAASFLRIGPGKGVSVDAYAALRPINMNVLQVGDALPGGNILEATPGNDGEGEPTGYSLNYFSKLDKIKDISLLAVPGVGTYEVMSEAMVYCNTRELQDLFFIGDMAYDDDEVSAVEFRESITSPNSYGAVYFPWIMAQDPSGRSSELIALPPSGFIAGLYARTDSRRGVWKAPAGTEAIINNSMGLTINLTDVKQGRLNKKGVNCIRRFPAAGIVSWGARTVTSDPEYKYVPVRRMAIMLRVSIYNGIQWAVFEPNDEPLWAQLRMNLKSFMMTLFRKGAFQGSSPDEAFFVKCDSETTTQDDINLGIVNIIVGFAPLKPAEFVMVKITQKAGQNS